MKFFHLICLFVFLNSFAFSQTNLSNAIDFTINTTESDAYNLFQILDQNKLVVLFFFTTENQACQEAITFINNSYHYFGCNSGNVVFLGVNYSNSNIEVDLFIESYGIEIPCASGLEGGCNAICQVYGVVNFPTLVLIASDHSISESNMIPNVDLNEVIETHGGIKLDCPEVLDADFKIEPMTLYAGGLVNFTDLSAGNPQLWVWSFNGGNPNVSTLQNPTGIQYNVPGTYQATLQVSDGVNSDIKHKNVYVVNSGVPIPDFIASETHIYQGDTVDFTDLTAGNPISWNWTFVGGNPIHSTAQNPQDVLYQFPGEYTVSLTVTNSFGQSFEIKHSYIKVEAGTPPVDYCDTLTNLLPYDSLMIQEVSPWGIIPGQNYYSINEYADFFLNNQYLKISGLIVPVHIASSTLSESVVRFKVWDGDSIPENVLAYKDIVLSSMTPNFYRIVNLDEPADLTGNFFVGYQITYNPGDNFAASIAKNRGDSAFNTIFLKYNNEWLRLCDIEQFGYLHSSLGIKPIVCNFPSEIQNLSKSESVIFPNPSTGKVNVYLEENFNHLKIKIYGFTGNTIPVKIENDGNLFSFDLTNYPSGIYFVQLLSDETIITSKIIISH